MSYFFKSVFITLFICSSVLSYSQESKKSNEDFNSWSVGAGFSLLTLHGDLRSFDTKSGDAYFNLGGYLYVDKMFNPVLGIEAKLNISQLGGEVQTLGTSAGTSESAYYRILYAEDYSDRILTIDGTSFGFESSLIIDIDNLWKRNSEKWNWAGYVGFGYQKYNPRVIIKDFNRDDEDYDPNDPEDRFHPNHVRDDGTINDTDFGTNNNRDFKTNAGSLYLNAALGVKYRLNDKLDIEARGVLNLNNEDHLDAAISLKQTYESFFTGNIGIVYKFGKKNKYAIWVHDKEDSNLTQSINLVDTDNDGVPDQFDKEPNTPKGAKVYGSGIAIDTDNDGLKDHEDTCPLEPGPISNNGCPIEKVEIAQPAVYDDPIIEEPVVVVPVVTFDDSDKDDLKDRIALLSKSIQFRSASDELKEESYRPLNEIVDVMKDYPDSRFKIEGHTDSRGNDSYNLNLSKKRAKSVFSFLVENGISESRLSSQGFGEVNPIATNETESGRQINRRVEINFIDPDSEEGKLIYPQGTVLKKSNVQRNNGSVTAQKSISKRMPNSVEIELSNLISRMRFARSEGHVLKENNIALLGQIGGILNKYTANTVMIEVHTNNKPNLSYNMDLSKRRAFAINKYLTQISGVSQDRIEVKGLGGSKPKFNSEIKTENAKNNRVEIIIQ